MMVKTILGPKTPISVSAICKDRLKRVWIAYSKFWTFKNLKKVGHKVRTDFWKRYLSENMCVRDADIQKIDHIMDKVRLAPEAHSGSN